MRLRDRLRRIGEVPRALALLAIVVWVNAYICRDLFYFTSAENGSMHGFWTALAAHFGADWLHPSWWPYWDNGIPIEATYAPLVPGLAAAIAALRHVSPALGFSSVTGLIYILAPCTLFFAAWRLTRDLRASFVGAMFYSLTSVTLIFVPEGKLDLTRFFDARRLFVLSTWDDTPHCVALALLPLIVLFLVRAIETRRVIYSAAAAASIAAAALASAFGPVMIVMAAVCLLSVQQTQQWRRNVLLVAGIGFWGYAIASPFLSPSLLWVIREASAVSQEEGWSIGSFSALACTVLGFVVIWQLSRRLTRDWRIRFAAFFAWVASSIPIAHTFLHRHFLPQPFRYKFEMELALALALVFLIHNWPFGRWTSRTPASVRFGIVFLLLSLTVEQITDYRKLEKGYTFPKDVSALVEYRVAKWAWQYDPSLRYYLAGSSALWANRFTDLQQFTGSSYTMATNQVQQRALRAITEGPPNEAPLAILWFKAYGVAAVAGSTKGSKEYWHPFFYPNKFDGVLTPLWNDQGVTVYRVPLRETSFAHVVPVQSIVRHPPQHPRDLHEVETYVAALDNADLPAASFQWEGRNQIRIRTSVLAGQAITVQESYHPGWHAGAGGQSVAIHKDGLGLMWLQPDREGPCDLLLQYDGGWELRICHWLSWIAIAALLVAPIVRRRPARG